MDLGLPNNFTYIGNFGFTGPLFNHSVIVDSLYNPSVPCRDSDYVWGAGVHVPPAYLELSVQINGVKYMVENSDLIRNPKVNLAPDGFCETAIITNDVPGKPDFWLGMPFLRSVYL